jgi:predicted transcriptional regulator
MPRKSMYRAPRRWDRNVTFVTSEAQWEELAELAGSRDVSVSRILREALTQYLKANSVSVDRALDGIAQDQTRREAERARLHGMDLIPLADAQDHIFYEHNRVIDPTCDVCAKILKQYPEAARGHSD